MTKALRLAARGNAVVVEWLRSPVIYRGDQDFYDLLAAFCTEHAPVEQVRRHYLHLAIGQRAKASQAVKKLFYLLRPTMALRWMRLNPRLLPPMHFPTLIDQCDLPAAVRDETADLLRRKAITRELGEAAPTPTLLAFADAEIARGDAAAETQEPAEKATAAADAALLAIITRFAPRFRSSAR